MARRSQKNVGIIGLGIIGSRIASVLRSKGWHVCVWNRTPKPEPSFLGSPAEVAAVCEVIQIFVADGAALMEVLNAFGNSLTERHTILCNATIGKQATLQAAEFVAATGAKFVDAPFTGSKAAAEKGALVYYVSGEEAVFQRVEPVLRASSKAIVRAGTEFGDAATIKIATNMMVGVTVQILAEAIALVRGAGIAPERFVEALEHHGVRSGITDMKIAGMIQGDFTPHFSVKHLLKDLKLGLNMAQGLELTLPTTSITAGRLGTLMNLGANDLDYSVLMTLYPQAQPLPGADGMDGKDEDQGKDGAEVESVGGLCEAAEGGAIVGLTALDVQKAASQRPPTDASDSSKIQETAKSTEPAQEKEPAKALDPLPSPADPVASEAAPKTLEAEVVSQSSTPNSPPAPSSASKKEPGDKTASKAPLAEKVRKWFSR